MKPHMDDFSRAGMDEVGAVRQLLAAHDYLRKDPKQAIQWLSQELWGRYVGSRIRHSRR